MDSGCQSIPPDDGRATLGGVVATGLSGAQRTGYGSPRNFVIGMKVVLADGTLIKAGGRVVKNVAGYDLCKLFTGSYGTLGLITELTFKLRPLPQKTATILAQGSFEQLLAGAKQIVDANLFPVAAELLSAAFSTAAGFSDGPESLLLVRFSGLENTVSQQASEALRLLTPHSSIAGPLAEDDVPVWRELAAMPLRFADRTSWRASVPASQLGNLLGVLQAKKDAMWQAGVADGRVRVIESSAADTDELVNSLKDLRREAESRGGSLMIESAPAEVKSKISAWGDLGSRQELMVRIKQKLDPRHLFAPGRFAGV